MGTRFIPLAVALTALIALSSGCGSQNGRGDAPGAAPEVPPGDLPGAAAGDAVRVPGTRVKLVPAQGFTLATSFSGFEDKAAKASLTVTSVPGPLSELLEAMSPEVLGQRGMKVAATRDVSAGSHSGKLLTVSNTNQGTAYDNRILLVGTESKALMIVAAAPEPISSDLEQQMLASLLSLQWDPDEEVDLFEGLGFRLPDSDSVDVERRTPNGLILRVSGNRGKVLMFVSKVTPQIPISQVEPFSIQRLKSMRELKDLGELDGQTVEFGAMKGYEVVGNAQHVGSGTEIRVYQSVLVSPSRSFLIGAIVAADWAEEYLDKFRAVARSLEPSS